MTLLMASSQMLHSERYTLRSGLALPAWVSHMSSLRLASVRCLRGGPDRRTHLTPARPGTPGSASRLLGSGFLLPVAARANPPPGGARLAYAVADRRAPRLTARSRSMNLEPCPG